MNDLRDQFAIAALPALIKENPLAHWDIVATEAYQYADAMMIARNKEH